MSRARIAIAAVGGLLLAAACRKDAGRARSGVAPAPPRSSPDPTAGPPRPAPDVAVRVIHVESSAHSGMVARVKWALSPDRTAMLVMADPSGVELDPVPNQFVFVREGGGKGGAIHREGAVWDVAPSPDWARLAYGRAYLFLPQRGDSISLGQWRTAARRLGLDAALLASGSFPASGMSMARGFARPVLADVSRAEQAGAADASPLPLDRAGGWRVRWLGDTLVAFGANPARAVDDAPSPRWTVVNARTGAVVREQVDTMSLARVAWVQGPLLDVGAPVDLQASRAVDTERYRFESHGGVLSVSAAGGEPGAARVIGPGLPLAATRTGRYLAAIVPRQHPREYERPNELVVLEITPRQR